MYIIIYILKYFTIHSIIIICVSACVLLLMTGKVNWMINGIPFTFASWQITEILAYKISILLCSLIMWAINLNRTEQGWHHFPHNVLGNTQWWDWTHPEVPTHILWLVLAVRWVPPEATAKRTTHGLFIWLTDLTAWWVQEIQTCFTPTASSLG